MAHTPPSRPRRGLPRLRCRLCDRARPTARSAVQYWNGHGDDGNDDSDPVCYADLDIGTAGDAHLDARGHRHAVRRRGIPQSAPGRSDLPAPPTYVSDPRGGPGILPVRDNMPPRGALDFIPQPEDYGYPPFSEGTEIEWEDPTQNSSALR